MSKVSCRVEPSYCFKNRDFDTTVSCCQLVSSVSHSCCNPNWEKIRAVLVSTEIMFSIFFNQHFDDLQSRKQQHNIIERDVRKMAAV